LEVAVYVLLAVMVVAAVVLVVDVIRWGLQPLPARPAARGTVHPP
jgi:hypothetical protein